MGGWPALASVPPPLDPADQGRGYATEAARALVEYAFDCGRVTLVRAHTTTAPNASRRVLTKCGSVCIGEVLDSENGAVWTWEKAQLPSGSGTQ